MPGVNIYPWDQVEADIWHRYYKGVITEAEAWQALVYYWLIS